MITYYVVYDNFGNFYTKELEATENFWEAATIDKKELYEFLGQLKKKYIQKLLTLRIVEAWKDENVENN